MIGGHIGKPIGGVINAGATTLQELTANVDCGAGTILRAVGKMQSATVECAAAISNRAVAFAQTALCGVPAAVTKAVTVTLVAAHVSSAAIVLKNAAAVLLATTVSVFGFLTRLALNITSRRVLQDPVDCVLAGDQHYKQSGREYEIRPMNKTEKTWGKHSSVRALSGGRPSFTSTTGKRGYD